MKKLKTTNLVRAVVGLLFVSQLSIALAADVISLWGGARGSIILKSDGTVWTWGTGGFGKLGINAFTGRSLVPVEVHGATNIDYLHSVMAVSRDDGIRHCVDAAASAYPLAQLCERPTARRNRRTPSPATIPGARGSRGAHVMQIHSSRVRFFHPQS